MRLSFGLIVVAALMLPAAASAQDAAATAAARQVVDLAVAPGIDGRFARMIAEAVAKLPADKQAAARADFTKTAAGIRQDLLAGFARYYAASFTAAELKDLAAFYQSPLGSKAIKVEVDKPAAVNAEIQQQIMKLVAVVNAPR